MSDDEHETTRYEILQITAAQPGTYALFRIPGGHTWREPVPAWGVWIERTDLCDERGRVIRQNIRKNRMSGPMILDFGYLEPATMVRSSQFVGVRFGSFVELDDDTGFDAEEDNQDPALKSDREESKAKP